jgi:PAS domain S-box-containing protein
MKNILIVDDKAENLYLLKSLLESGDYKTLSAKNGAEAIGIMKLEIPDLIISDILMPVMDGFTLCRECKKDTKLRNIPFIFYTATYTDEKDEKYALSLGADRFILKPQEPEYFLKLITDFLNEIKKKKVKHHEITIPPESVVLKEYNEVLIRKIEDKMLQTEKKEKELQRYAEKLENEVKEREKSESALRESEMKYRQLVTQSPDGIFVVNLSGFFVSVNPAICSNLKYTEEELLSKRLLDLIPEKYHKQHEQRLSVVLKGETFPDIAEYEVIAKDGDCFHVEVLSVPYYAGNQITGFQGIARDITIRKKFERELLVTETRYRQIFENVQDLYYETTLSGIIIELSPSVEQMTRGQYKRDDLIGKSMYDFYNKPEERDILINKMREEGKVSDYEVSLKNRDGSIIHWTVTTKILYGSNGLPEKIVGSARDITDRWTASVLLKESEERFRSYFESTVAGIAITSTDKKWIEVNNRLC